MERPNTIADVRDRYDIVEVVGDLAYCYGGEGQERPSWVYQLLPHVGPEAVRPLDTTELGGYKRPQGGNGWNPEPGPQRLDWIDFLHWLADDQLMGASDLVYVVEKPWKYTDHYREYLEAGGLNR